MVTTNVLHIASSLLLVPYGLLCVYGIKAKIDLEASETELGGEEEQGTFIAWFDRLSVSCCLATLLDFQAISPGLITVHVE